MAAYEKLQYSTEEYQKREINFNQHHLTSAFLLTKDFYMASGLSIVIDTRNAELNIKNLNQALERLETQGNSVANMMRNLGGANPFAGLNAAVNITKAEFNALATSANLVKSNVKEMGDSLVYAKTTLTGAATAATTFQAAMRGVGNSLNTAQAAMARFNQSGQSIASVLNTMNGASGSNGVNNLNNAIKQLNPNVAALNAEFKAINTTLNSFTTATNKADAAALRLNTTLTATRTNLTGLATANAAVNASIGNLGNVLNNLQTRLAGLGTTLNGLNANLRNLPPLNNAAASSANNAAASTSLFQRNAQGLEATLMRLQSLMMGGIFGMAALSVLKTADEMQNLDNQVRIVTKSTEERLAVERQIHEIANRNYSDLVATTNIYHRNALAMASMGASQKDVLRFTDNMSLAMRTSGRTITEQNSALYQWSQAMGAGKLQGQEFRIIALAVPSLLKYIAAEMGVTVGQLKKLGAEGKIVPEVMVSALEKARPELEKLASQMPMTMSQAFSQVKNEYKLFVDDILNGTGGLGQGIASVLKTIGTNFGTFANIIGGVAAVSLAKYAAGMASAAIASSGFNAANLTVIGTTAIANASMRTLSVFLTGVSVASRAAAIAQGALNLVTTPLSVTFARASASISAAATALTRWSTYSGVAAAASTRLGAATVLATGAFARCAAILNAHPLMFLATVLFGVVASTEGVEGAMKSLGDAIGVVGYVLSDFIKAGVQGFGYLLNAAGGFVAGMVNGTKDGANKGTANLGVFFENTRGGFVGILQGVSRMVDAAIITITSTFTVAVRKLENFVIGVKNAYNNIQGFFGMENKQTGYVDSSLSTALGENYDKLGGSLTESLINNGIAQQDYQKQAKASAEANADLTKTIDPQLAAMNKQQKAAEAAAEAQKKKTKADKEAAKAQRELLNGARLVGVSGNTGRSTGAHLDIRVSGGGRRLTDAELARFQAGGKNLSAYTKTSEYGSRVHPVTGKRHTHGGIDFAMPVGTPITTKVAIKDIKSFYDSKGGGYVQRILFADGLSVDLLHQSPKAQGIKGGASTGIAKLDGMMSKLDNAYDRQAEKAAREREQLEQKRLDIRQKYGTKEKQLEAQLTEDIKKIKEAKLPQAEETAAIKQATANVKRELKNYQTSLVEEASQSMEFSLTTTQQLINERRKANEKAMNDPELSKPENVKYLQQRLDSIKAEFDYKDEVNRVSLAKQRNELTAYQKDERQMIVDNWDSQIDEARLKFDELSDIRIETLKAQKDRALEIFDLEQSQKLLDLQKFNMADIAYFEQTLRIKNDLVDKSNATQAMKDAQKAANNYQNRKDVLGVFKNQPENLDRPMFFGKGAEGQYQEAMYNAAETIRVYSESYATLEQMGLTHSQVMTDLQTAYSEKVRQDNEAIMASERAVAEERFGIMSQVLGMADTVWSSMTDMVKKSFGEQSAAARAMFFVQKGIAAAQAIINTEVAATKAMAEGGFIMGIPMSTAIRTLGYASAGIIAGQGIAGLFGKGFSTGGYTGNMGVNDIAGVVHGKEYVVNARNTVKYRDTLEQMNRGTYKEGSGVNVNIINNAGVPVQQTQDSNGDIRVIIGEELAKQLPQHVNDEYSDFNQHLKRKYHIQRRL